ncbi:guanylate-binding protein 1-like, partial [Mercenaria mercenaria]|uniref:guanylate-binding protein 1-like n=1 Tax=Mercenaria mercenaria TaxID=6596 RepID=UPI00234F3DA8
MCIISTAKDGTLQLEDEPMKQIEQIDQPLVVVAIAGLYRTGKSYLMNCLAGETKGFPLGNTTESETKGIWAWCRIHPIINNQVLLLLDTEGLGDIAKGNNDHDNKIFVTAALLCNVLVYNMMSTFNQDAIEKLTFISEMSKHIIFANGGNNTDEKFDLILPTFVLCLRDFSLDMKKDGRNLTQDEYLEDCLELKPGRGKEIEKFNRPRDCIRRYFPKRKCFTFDRPGSRAVMKRLETARKEELSEDFLEETEIFLQYMYNCKPKVILGSKPFQGKMFKKLAETYISDIRSGVIPDVDDAIQMVANMENERMANIAVEEFKAKLQAIQLPILQVQKFSNLYTDIQNAILANFRSEAMFESEKFEKRAL